MSISKYFVKNVATIKKDATIEEAIDVMRSYDVDDVVVVENRVGKPYPLGFLTSHDIVMKAFKTNANEREALVKDIMSSEPVTCAENHGIQETISLMQRNDIKRLPVVDENGVLVGIVTASDLFGVLSEEFSGLTQRKERQTWRNKQAITAQTAI